MRPSARRITGRPSAARAGMIVATDRPRPAPDGGPLAGQVAVVTGGGRGIGRAVARALGAGGAAVAVLARSAAEVEASAAEIEGAGGSALPLVADVTDAGAVDAAFASAEGALGPPDLLVNCAGRLEAVGPAWAVEAGAWRRDLDVNLLGPYLCCRAVLPGMTARRSGRIVNVASWAATRPDPYSSAYGAAKAALVHLTGSLAVELRPYGVTVLAVAPGTVATALTRRLRDSEAGRRWLPALASRPADSWVSPERAAELVLALARGRGDALSGRFLHVVDDLDELAARAAEIESEDLHVLRFRR